MTNDLKPLSAEEAAIFESRRESAAVVQHKCDRCNVWWETDKGSKQFQESFICDCGNPISFTVPALDGVRELTNEERLALADPDARLDTGMKAREALQRASSWWNTRGRFLVIEVPKMKRFALDDPADNRFMPSGILNGHTWEMLGLRERIMVVKVWHHFHVRKPDLIGDPDQPHSMQNRNAIN